MKASENNEENRSKITERYFTVPGDMLIDILSVLVNNGILYQIKTVDLNDNSILLYLTQKGQRGNYAKAIENIETMLNEFKDYSRLLQF